MNRFPLLAAVVLALAAVRASAGGAVTHVDDDAPAGGDGSSWAAAYRFLQDALSRPGVAEIRVAQGTYRPDRSAAVPGGTGDREATFQLLDGVTVLGGWAGVGAPDPDTRDTALYETVLSGDLLGDDPAGADNSYSVVTGSGTGPTAVLDGVTITAGIAGAPPAGPFAGRRGAGLFVLGGSPTLVSCRIVGNVAVFDGGGAYLGDGSHAALTGCTIAGNRAVQSGGGLYVAGSSHPALTGCEISGNTADNGDGGGMVNDAGSSPTVTGCVFENNAARSSGGGMQNQVASSPAVVGCRFTGNSTVFSNGGGLSNFTDCSPLVVNCVFEGNFAGHNGGGIGNFNRCHPTIVNTLFAGNEAADDGGAVRTGLASSPTLLSCTLAGNTASAGGAVAAGQQSGDDESLTVIRNCILWGNMAAAGPQIAISGNIPAAVTVEFSDVQGGPGAVEVMAGGVLTWGAGNLDADPLLAGPAGGEGLDAGSPCIDAGDAGALPPDVLDLDGDEDTAEPLPLDAAGDPRRRDDPCRADTGAGGPPAPDMGALEAGGTSCDLDGDGTAGITDLLMVLSGWGPCPGPCPPSCPADFNGDCVVGINDFLMLLVYWGEEVAQGGTSGAASCTGARGASQ